MEERKLHLDIYTDGSYHSAYKVYGGGLVILIDGLSAPLEHKPSGRDPQHAALANIAGELLAAMQALNIAEKAGASSVKIFHDYVGIHNWVKNKGEHNYWKANRTLTRAYVAYVYHLKTEKNMHIEFEHIPGHSGNIYNERADFLAKQAVKECIASMQLQEALVNS